MTRIVKGTPVFLLGCFLLVASGTGWGQRSTADDEAIRVLYNDFFEAFRQGGAQGAAGYLRQSGTVDPETLTRLERRGRVRLEMNPMVGRPDSWVALREAEIPGALRYRVVYAMTHHDGRAVAWRLRFYQKVTGLWVFTDVQWEDHFVEDFLNLPEIQFIAYERILVEDSSKR